MTGREMHWRKRPIGYRQRGRHGGGRGTVSDEHVLHRFRLALFAPAGEVGVTDGRREFGVHRSTYYRWRRKFSNGSPRRSSERWLPQLGSMLAGLGVL